MKVPPGSRGRSVSDYDYALPPELIARHPAERRDESRLLVLTRGGGPIEHLRFREIVSLFRSGDVLVINESRVLPARLLGRKPSGAGAEILLLRPVSASAPGGAPAGPAAAGRAAEPAEPDWPATELPPDAALWEALVRPGSKLKPGRRVVVSPELEVAIVDSTEGGGRIVRLETPLTVEEALRRYGHVPLPPYLEREDEPGDRERYQTVYARTPGSVAAPTAGLHFTPELLDALEAGGVAIARITLHVGVGTFRPVEVEKPALHEMHSEFYSVSAEAAAAVNAARRGGGRVWAVGTTAVRTLESVAGEGGTIASGSGETDLFLYPPHDFRAVDAFITNFHLPRSTLLMLVAAFAGYERTMEAYAEAIRERYRFYSYGDAMVVLP